MGGIRLDRIQPRRKTDLQARTRPHQTEAQRKLKEIIREYEDGLVIGGYGYT